jgi:hypothetical protein
MGNRVSRFWSRKLVDYLALFVVFPLLLHLSMVLSAWQQGEDWMTVVALLFMGSSANPTLHGARYYEKHAQVDLRPAIVVLGFLRSILPFAMSFQGSRLGRQGVGCLVFSAGILYFSWHVMLTLN